MLIDRLEKSILNTDFADWTDFLLFGLKEIKSRMFCYVQKITSAEILRHPNPIR